jgi:type IV pilus assembly protein PilM
VSDSFWKKEIRLRKKPEPLPPLPAHLLERSRGQADRPKGTVVVPVVPDSDPLKRIERWTTSASPAPAERPATVEFPKPAAGEGQDPVSLLPARATVDPAPVAPDLPKPASTYGWTKPAVEAPAPVVESISAYSLRTPAEPPAVTPEPVLEEAAALPVAAAEPQVAPESAPAPEKVPLLKREVSFKRKKKANPGVAEKEPVAAEAPRVDAEKTPLLKRDVSFKRKPKAEKPPKAKKEKTPKAERKPALKRELHLPRPSRKLKPAPGHKVENVIGLHIGSSQLAAAHVLNNGHAEVVQLARRPLDRGLVVDGEVRDTPALTRELKEFFSANKLPRKDVRLGIASSRIGVRILEVPSIADPKQFENAIRFRAQELLPIPVTDAILDHVVLGEHVNDEGDVLRRVLLVFAHRDLVNRFVETCRGAGIRLSGIDLDAFALLRAVGTTVSSEGASSRAIVAVSIGHERTVLAVSDGKVCDFTRVLEWGGSSLDVALARAIDLTPSQAEPIKHQLSLDTEEAPDGLTPLQLEAAKSALRSEVGVLGRELVSSLRFYQSRPDSHAIGEILLAGGGAQLGGLSEELQRLLGTEVRVADPFAAVTLGKKVAQPESPSSLAVAVGLGIEA